MDIMEYKVSAIKQSDLSSICGCDFSRKLYDLLYDTASYKKDERGWSFFIKKDYLEGLLKDIKVDKEAHPDYDYLSSEEITFLEKVLELFGENYLLLIDNDGLIK